MVVDPTDTTKKQTFTGIIDTGGVQLTSVVWTAGTNQIHTAGATVVDYATATHIAMISKGLQVEHKQAGTHSAVTADSVTVATGKITTTAVGKLEDMAVPLTTYRSNYLFDFVVSGGVWTADSVGVNLNASMTAIVVMINGRRISIGAVTARPFTLNVDTYIDILDNADGTGTLVYTTAATNAASPALAANSMRIGIIQAAATITATTKVNQGQEDKVFPIASSIPYAVTDSLGNLICPRDPNRKVLGYRQIISNANTTSTTAATVTGLTVPVIIPTGRKFKISYSTGLGLTNSGANGTFAAICLTSGADANRLQQSNTTGTSTIPATPIYMSSSVAGSQTFVGTLAVGAGTGTLNANAVSPAFVMVELA